MNNNTIEVGKKRERGDVATIKEQPAQKKIKMSVVPWKVKMQMMFKPTQSDEEEDEAFRLLCIKDSNIGLLYFVRSENGRDWLSKINALTKLPNSLKMKKMRVLYTSFTNGKMFKEIFSSWKEYHSKRNRGINVHLPKSLRPKKKKHHHHQKTTTKCPKCNSNVLKEQIIDPKHGHVHCTKCTGNSQNCCECEGEEFSYKYGCECPDCLKFVSCVGCGEDICGGCCDGGESMENTCHKCGKKGWWCPKCQITTNCKDCEKDKLWCRDCCEDCVCVCA